MPGPSDVACIGTGTTVEVSGGANEVSTILDEGSLVVSSTLELQSSNSSEPSVVRSLTLNGGDLSVAGRLDVQSSLSTSNQVALEGPGSLVLDSGATGSLGNYCASLRISQATLVNEGVIDFGISGGAEDGAIAMGEAGVIRNVGTFYDDSYDPGCGYGFGGTSFAKTGGTAPSFENAGTFIADAGPNEINVEVPFGNEGHAEASGSSLRLGDGGIPETFANGSWSASGGGAIVWWRGDFWIREGVDTSEISMDGASVHQASHPADTSSPIVTGEAMDTETLSATLGSWTGFPTPSLDLRWQRCNSAGGECSDIPGATGESYLLTGSDIGKTIKAVATATNLEGSTNASSTATSVVEAASAPSNTSAPEVVGSPLDGQAAEAEPGSWKGITPIAYSYQWELCNASGQECEDIAEATAARYVPDTSQIGDTLRVHVVAADTLGSGDATSAASTAIGEGPPREIEAPSVEGSARVGQTLAAEPGAWEGTEPQVAYQWERCWWIDTACSEIPGATESVYQIGESDLGARLRLRVGVANQLGSATAVSHTTAEVLEAIPNFSLTDTSPPAITGTLESGQTLTASSGTWLGTGEIGYGYTWERCDLSGSECNRIAGSESSNYVAKNEDVGHTLRVVAEAYEITGSTARSSAATAPIAAVEAPVTESAPTISGTPLVGYMLTATDGAWSHIGSATFTEQWERCNERGEGCEPIAGASSDAYTLTEADAGSTVRFLVTGENTDAEPTQAVSAAMAIDTAELQRESAPSLMGTTDVGRPLIADSGIWTAANPIEYSYEWLRCNEEGKGCMPISGATSSSYTPREADAGETLAMTVTARSGGTEQSASTEPSPVVLNASIVPEALFAPATEGAPTQGRTLTASSGTWLGSEPISYAFQWQRCNEEGEECANIAEATGETYTLAEADVGATVRVVVTATNSAGSESAESPTGETVGAPGPPAADHEGPAIRGEAEVGQQLFAENGAWSGSRPLSFSYRWERCDAAGETCAAIPGATAPSYTATGEDASHTLRLTVTATNALGQAATATPTMPIASAGEASTSPAIELAEEADPSALQPSTSTTLEEQEVKPATSDPGEELAATTTLTAASVSKETPGEFAVNTPNGLLSIAPEGTETNATKLPTIVNDTVAIYSDTYKATNTIVRPEALGASTLLELRSAEAPSSFSWEIGLGPDQYLEHQSDGSVAVVESAPESYFEELPGEPFESSSESGEASEAEEFESEAAEKGLEGSVEEESPLEKLPTAPHASTPEASPKEGELHPQDTVEQYERGTSAMETAETETAGKTLMVIEAPTVLDASGKTVPGSLSVDGDTVTLTITTDGDTPYPVSAQAAVAAPTNATSATAGHTVRYGLSDPKPQSFTITEGAGEPVPGFDPHLGSGPMHVGTARIVINFNTPPGNSLLKEWLKAVGNASLQPYITLRECIPTPGFPQCSGKPPSRKKYEERVSSLISGLRRGNPAEKIPPVSIWGAWNEPDDKNIPAPQAASFWQIAQAAAKRLACKCTVVAGEFLRYNPTYAGQYISTIVKTQRRYGRPHVWGLHDYEDLVAFYKTGRNNYADNFLNVTQARLGHPHVWLSELGVELQDNQKWTPLVCHRERQEEAAEDFLHIGPAHPRIEREYYYLYVGPTLSQINGGIEKHDFDSALLPGAEVTEEDKCKTESPRPAYCELAFSRHKCPASDATLPSTISSNARTESMVALTVNPESAPTNYFVEYGTTSSYGQSTSPTLLPNDEHEQSASVMLTGLEACTTYHYQAEAYNESNEGIYSLGGDQTFSTACEETQNGMASWGGNEDGELGRSTSTLSCDALCGFTPHEIDGVTDVKEVAAGGEQGLVLLEDGVVLSWGSGLLEPHELPTFVVGEAIAIAAGENFGLALLADGKVMSWGFGGQGQLGNGTSESSVLPVEVSGITDATSIAAGSNFALARLSDGSVVAWGANSLGQLGDATIEGPTLCFFTPCSTVPVSVDISGVRTVAAGASDGFAIMENGTVESWGYGADGELGNGGYPEYSDTPVKVTGLENIVSIAADGINGYALTSSGSVQSWGGNYYGQLGEGSTSPDECGLFGILDCSTTPVAVDSLSEIVAIAAGGAHEMALLSDGKVKTWGEDSMGQLGTDSLPPELCGEGSALCSTTPVEVHDLGAVQGIAAGRAFDLAWGEKLLDDK